MPPMKSILLPYLQSLWPSNRSLSFSTACISKIGGREANEDSMGETRTDNRICLVVADGLGGHGAGEVASKIAVKTIIDGFNRLNRVSSEEVKQLLLSASEAIAHARPITVDGNNMASTGAVLVVAQSRVIYGHVGDSRIYRFRNHQCALLTDDHSMAQVLVKMGNLAPDQIRFCPDRNSLLQSLGDIHSKPDISKPESIKKDDVFLICSDGWWDYLDEHDMMLQLKDSSSLNDWLENLEKMLLIRVAEQGKQQNHDNYTALALRIEML